MPCRTHRRPLFVVALLSAVIGSASAAPADDGAGTRKASAEETSPGDADAVASWVDETVAEQPVAEPAHVATGRRFLHRNGVPGEAKASGSPASASKEVFETSLFEMAWPMLVVLFVISVCVYAFKRWMPRSSRPGGGDAVKILARHYLSSKQSLCLVRTGRRVVLVGITPDRISTLTEVTDAEEVASLVGSAERASPSSFTKMFARLTERELVDEAAESDDDGCPPFPRERGIREDLLVSASNLANTGKNVQDLIERVRSLSSDTDAPAYCDIGVSPVNPQPAVAPASCR